MNELTNLTYRTRYREKSTIPDSRVLVFVTGFFLGLVFFYFIGKQWVVDSGLLSQEYLEPLKDFPMNQSGYLLYIIGIRAKQFLFLLFCSLSIWAGCLLYSVLGWCGFQLGILAFLALYQYGVWGGFYCLFMLIPHGFFYFLVFVKLLNRKVDSDKKYYHKNIDINSSRAKKMYEDVKIICSSLLLLCLGILSESYINPCLMKWILLFF